MNKIRQVTRIQHFGIRTPLLRASTAIDILASDAGQGLLYISVATARNDHGGTAFIAGGESSRAEVYADVSSFARHRRWRSTEIGPFFFR